MTASTDRLIMMSKLISWWFWLQARKDQAGKVTAVPGVIF